MSWYHSRLHSQVSDSRSPKQRVYNQANPIEFGPQPQNAHTGMVILLYYYCVTRHVRPREHIS